MTLNMFYNKFNVLKYKLQNKYEKEWKHLFDHLLRKNFCKRK